MNPEPRSAMEGHASFDGVIVIGGPTASGKSALALELSRHLPIEILSADSRQIYKHLDIGTAKPSPDELAAVPHHFIDIFTPDRDYNSGEFSDDARKVIEEVRARGNTPVIAGGSGLYIQALIDGFFNGPGRDEEIRSRLELEMESVGREEMYRRLSEIDPDAAMTMDPTKPRRIVRALEVYALTGRRISELQKENDPLPYRSVFFALQWDRAKLYACINRRVEAMIDAGLIAEVERLSAMGYPRALNALQTVGYREVFQYLEQEIPFEEMVRLIKQNSRRYAKRQLTWFRADERIHWLPMNSHRSIPVVAEELLGILGVK